MKITDIINISDGELKENVVEYFNSFDGTRFFGRTLDSLTDGVIAIDSDGAIFFINEAYSQLLGVPRKKIIGRNLRDVEPGATLLKALDTHKPYTMNHTYIKTINKYVSGEITPIFDGDKFLGAVSVFKDSTEMVRLNKRIEQANNIVSEMQNRMETFEQLASQEIVGKTPEFLNVMQKADIAARTDAPVMIRGENGVGKELVAKFIHSRSQRKDKPLITVNCAAIPENLIESELFGYEEGSFTGAKKGGRAGKFEMANGGTLFLDEIGDMPYAMQTKLLRAIQEKQIEKIGTDHNIYVDVRIITATNQPLEEMMDRREFRRDLYYRINTVELIVPPLRDRREDLAVLSAHFLNKYNEQYGKEIAFAQDISSILDSYDWPGNIRELKNCIEYGVIMSQNGLLDKNVLNIKTDITSISASSEMHTDNASSSGIPSTTEMDILFNGLLDKCTLKEAGEAAEKAALISALKKFDGDKEKVMSHLNISRRTFYRKISELNIDTRHK